LPVAVAGLDGLEVRLIDGIPQRPGARDTSRAHQRHAARMIAGVVDAGAPAGRGPRELGLSGLAGDRETPRVPCAEQRAAVGTGAVRAFDRATRVARQEHGLTQLVVVA